MSAKRWNPYFPPWYCRIWPQCIICCLSPSMTEYRHEHDWLSAPEPTLPPAMSELRITSCSDRITKRLYSQYMGWPRHNSSPDIITQCICCLWLMGLIIFKCWEEVIRWYKLDNVSASVTNATLLNIRLCHTHHLTLSQIFHD